MEIKDRWTDNVIFTTPEANLYGANLRGADLRGANLYGARYGDDIIRGFLQVGTIGSRQSVLQIFAVGKADFIFKTGCFSGSKEEFIAAINKTHDDNPHVANYLAAIRLAEQMLPEVPA
jgi:hypothetical protein